MTRPVPGVFLTSCFKLLLDLFQIGTALSIHSCGLEGVIEFLYKRLLCFHKGGVCCLCDWQLSAETQPVLYQFVLLLQDLHTFTELGVYSKLWHQDAHFNLCSEITYTGALVFLLTGA